MTNTALTLTKNIKRTIILCVFFMFSCSDPEVHETDVTDEQAQELQAPTPLLTLSELLAASDLQDALAKAAEQGDKQVLTEWQNMLLEAADEVNLAQNERKLITGEQGLVFLEFQGMKVNYQRAFEEAFFNFGDVDAVYEKYPAFQQMHARSKQLVAERDALIASIAEELKQRNLEGDVVEQAKTQWQQFMREQQNPK